MSLEHGGPAFPVADYDHQTFQPATIDECKRQLSGMSLRDYFAAKAMPVIMAEMLRLGKAVGQDQAFAAYMAFKMADDMLKERDK